LPEAVRIETCHRRAILAWCRDAPRSQIDPLDGSIAAHPSASLGPGNPCPATATCGRCSLRSSSTTPRRRSHVLGGVASGVVRLGVPRLAIVKPATVVAWHRRGYRAYWRHISRKRGRPTTDSHLRDLIRRMVTENPWGAPRIHGELLKLGFRVSERTVSRTRASVDRRGRRDRHGKPLSATIETCSQQWTSSPFRR